MAAEGGSWSERVHERKGVIKRILGWLTADRRVEAEGLAEERAGASPSEAEVARTEHEIKRDEYKETLDAPEVDPPSEPRHTPSR